MSILRSTMLYIEKEEREMEKVWVRRTLQIRDDARESDVCLKNSERGGEEERKKLKREREN